MAVCGHDSDSPDHAVRMMAMATDMLEAVKAVSTTMGRELQIRVGMHTGEQFIPQPLTCTLWLCRGLLGASADGPCALQ